MMGRGDRRQFSDAKSSVAATVPLGHGALNDGSIPSKRPI